MNNFYSANGNMNNYNIIEYFEGPTEGVSVISHLIESEKQKNKVIELENQIKELKLNISNFDKIIDKKLNTIKLHLPFDNNEFSKIESKKNNNWMSEEDKLFIDVSFNNKYTNIPKVVTELILNREYELKLSKRVSNLDINGFRINIKLLDFNLDDYNVKNNSNFSNELEMLKSDLTLNYIVIG
jgi:hypothetical protein